MPPSPQPNKLNPLETPIAVLAEGCFGAHESKTAIGVIRYGQWPVSAVIDSHLAGKRVNDVLSVPCEAPIVASLHAALQMQPMPKALLIGTAPMGGGLPDTYRAIVKEALEAGLHVISGLHVFLNQQADLVALAERHGVMLWDVRTPSEDNVIAHQLPRPESVRVITLVGSDCSVGKMSAGLELNKSLQQAGEASQFVATGQTGIMITGSGIPLDRVIGDFMAGFMERAVDEAIQQHSPRWVIVEGQGSLLHPAYSGVTMSLLHGSAPDAMVLCHNPRLTTINKFEKVPLPPLSKLVEIYETAAGWIKPANVLGICLNTSTYTREEAKALIQATEAKTGLPTTDAVSFGVDKLMTAIQKAFPTSLL